MTKYNLNLDAVSGNSGKYKKQNENNYCGQIFSKETAFTSDTHKKLEETETEIESGRTKICGLEWTTKQLWGISGLLLIFLSGCFGVASIFATAEITTDVVTNPVIINNSVVNEQWRGPIVTTLIKFYIFNYTNVDEYEEGSAPKLHVEEIGPFVYEEFPTKINIKFHPNDTVSYQKQRTYKYRADLSKGRENETVIVPNIFLMALAAAIDHSTYLSRISMSTLLSSMSYKPFLSLPVSKVVRGYDDHICILLNDMLPIGQKMPCKKNGLLSLRNGTSEDVITVNTGKNDINKIGQIDNYNGQTKLTHWSTETCNEIQGSDGTIFPPDTIRQKEEVYVYFKESCRRLPMVYEKEVEFLNGKVLVYKYVLPDTVFDSPESNPENQCFCNMETGSCAPQGLFNCSLCVLGVPLFVSFPHFYKADADVRNAITGLTSGVENHESYFNIQPDSGFVITSDLRLQINVQVRKSAGFSQLDMFKDNVILPVSWIEVSVAPTNFGQYLDKKMEINDPVATTTPWFGTSLKIAFLSMAIVALIVIVTVLYVKYRGKVGKSGKQNEEIPRYSDTKN